MLSFSFLAPNGVQLNCEFCWVVHFNTDNYSEQAVHSVTRFPRSLYTDVHRFGSRSVRLNAEVCYRREGAEATSIAKVPVFMLLLVAVFVGCCCIFCFVLFVSAPAHILCLTVASGWNKERCMPEIEITVTMTEKSSILVNLLYLLTIRVWLYKFRPGVGNLCFRRLRPERNQPLVILPVFVRRAFTDFNLILCVYPSHISTHGI
jgi:hypothetical protein